MKKRNIYLLIILVFLLIRLPILFTFGQHLDGDESVVGIMAKHIIEKGERPLAYYGQSYGGGHLIEAYTAAFLFRIFGISAAALKLIPLLFSLGIILLAFYLADRYFNRKTAVITSILLLTAGSFLRPSLKANGYMETIFICMLSFILFLRILADKKGDFKTIALFGFLSGMAYWSFEFALAYIAFYLIMFFAFDKGFFRRNVFIFFIFLLVGLSPLLVTKNFTDSIGIISLPKENIFIHFFSTLASFFIRDMPSFLGIDNVHNFVEKIPFTSWVYYAIFLAAFGSLVYTCRKSMKNFVVSAFSRKSPEFKTETAIILFFVFYAVFYSLSKFGGIAPRFLVPLYPHIAIMIALFAAKANKNIAIAMVSVLVITGLFEGVSLLKADSVTDGLIETPYTALPRAIDFLNQQDIKQVYTPYFLKWRLIFLTEEKIIASCDRLCACGYRYPEYELAVDNANNYAYILHSESTLKKAIEEFLNMNKIEHKTKVVDTLTIYYDLKARPRDMLTESCPWSYAFV